MKRRQNRNANSKIAVAYIRVSTDKERQELGAEAQKQAVASWASKNGVTIAAWYTEEITGGASLDRRLVLNEAIAALPLHKAGVLVFQKWERFTRDAMSTAVAELEVARHGAILVPADGVGAGSDPASELTKDVILATAKFEKSIIRGRIRAAMAVKRTRGEATSGNPPYGYRKEGSMVVPEPAEQALIGRVLALRGTGMPFRQLRAAIGPASRTGREFTLAALHAMTANG